MDLDFTTDRGEKLRGIVELPATGNPPWPTVIFCHGFLSNKNSSCIPSFSNHLAAAGYAVYRYDLPGHGESGGDKAEVTLPRNLQDVSKVIDILSARPEMDSGRIAITGHSFGGMTALLSPTVDQRIKTAVSVSGALNFRAVVDHLLGCGKMEWRGEHLYFSVLKGLAKQRCHQILYEYSQKFDVRDEAVKIKIPVLLIHGTKDKTIPLALARESYEVLPGNDKKMVEISGAGHMFLKPWHQKKIISETKNWLAANL